MRKINLCDVVTLLLSLILCGGAMTIFSTCESKADGSWMLCHWAGQVVIGLGGVMSVISLAKFFVNSEIQKGLSLALIPLAAFIAYIPNHAIKLCQMETMQCQAIFKPSVILVSVLIAAAATINIFLNRKAD